LFFFGFQNHKGICHAGCATLGAVCLRMTDNAQQVVSSGGAEALIQVLRTHKDNAKVSVAAINAMRNIVSRSKHLVEPFLALDVEELLNEVGSIHVGAQDNVKAALRDMGLKVHLKEEWTGTKGLNIE